MEILLARSAQRIISRTHPLRPLDVRNVPCRLDRGQAEDYLRKQGTPSFGRVDEYIGRLVDLEPQIGTARATLVGLLATSKAITSEQVILGLSYFDEISSDLFKLPSLATINVRELYDLISCHLVFAPSADFEQGLLSFKGNVFNQNNQPIGNCVVCSSLFSLLALDHGLVAGEMHKKYSIHSLSYLLAEGVEMIYHRDGGTGFLAYLDNIYDDPRENINPGDVVIGSAFSFIASILISKVVLALRQQAFSGKAKQELFFDLLDQIIFAGEINPFYWRLYEEAEKICQVLGNRDKWNIFNEAKVEIEELAFQGGKPLIML